VPRGHILERDRGDVGRRVRDMPRGDDLTGRE